MVESEPLTAHRSPLTAHRSPLTAHRALLAQRSWILGIVNPGVWLLALESSPITLTLGVNIGWLPGNHTSETDLLLNKILSTSFEPADAAEAGAQAEEEAAEAAPAADAKAAAASTVVAKDAADDANAVQLPPDASDEASASDDAAVPEQIYENIALQRQANSAQLAKSWSRSSVCEAPKKPPRLSAGLFPSLGPGPIAASLRRAASSMQVRVRGKGRGKRGGGPFHLHLLTAPSPCPASPMTPLFCHRSRPLKTS